MKCPKCGSNLIISLLVYRYDGKGEYACQRCNHRWIYPPETVFSQITQSPAVLAEKFVIKECNRYGGSSYRAILLIDENGNYRDFYSREEALAATVEYLNQEIGK